MTTVRRSSTTRPRSHRATTSSSVRSARTTTTPKAATTSWRQNAGDRPQRRRRRLRLGVPPVRHRPAPTTTWRSTTTWSACRSRSSSTATVGRRPRPTPGRPVQRHHPGHDRRPEHDRRRRVHRVRRARPGRRRPHRRARRAGHDVPVTARRRSTRVGSGRCPLTGATDARDRRGNVWAEGDILLGGGGSDLIEGRGDDDIIDGDRSLRVRISVRTNPDGTGPEIGSDRLDGTPVSPHTDGCAHRPDVAGRCLCRNGRSRQSGHRP